MAEFTTDVLIVGTGPAGSACAALLSTYGVENMLVNMYRWLANTPRAHITNQRTMEVLRDLGQEVEQEAYLHATSDDLMGGTVFCESLTGEEIGRALSYLARLRVRGNRPLRPRIPGSRDEKGATGAAGRVLTGQTVITFV